MIGRNIQDALSGVALLVFLAAVAYVAMRILGGCTPSESNAMGLSIENSLAIAQYDQALVECKKTAKRRPKPEQFETYQACEDDWSKHLCSESAGLRRHWPRCSELGFAKE